MITYSIHYLPHFRFANTDKFISFQWKLDDKFKQIESNKKQSSRQKKSDAKKIAIYAYTFLLWNTLEG